MADKEDDVLRVQYTGTANQRILTRRDFAQGDEGDLARALVFQPGDQVTWDDWQSLIGDEVRARATLSSQAHEFRLVGSGADEFLKGSEVEEFSVEG